MIPERMQGGSEASEGLEVRAYRGLSGVRVHRQSKGRD